MGFLALPFVLPAPFEPTCGAAEDAGAGIETVGAEEVRCEGTMMGVGRGGGGHFESRLIFDSLESYRE